MRTVAIALPWDRPPLMANDRHHWAKRARLVRQVRLDTTVAVSRALADGGLPRGVEHLHARLLWHPKVRRARDSDGPSVTLKAAVDAVTALGIVHDDDHEHVTHHPTRFDCDCARPGHVDLLLSWED